MISKHFLRLKGCFILLLVGLTVIPVLAQKANVSDSTIDCRQFLDEKDPRNYSPNEIEKAIFLGKTETCVSGCLSLTNMVR